MRTPSIAIIGAGAFGGWTALHLLRRGAKVQLFDAWGPGNSRASSGGETRIIRGTYGGDQPYTRMAVRALRLWRDYEQGSGHKLLHRTGVLWMARAGDDLFERDSLPVLTEAGVPFEQLGPAELRRRWPHINFDGVNWAIFEPESGFLTARVACQRVLETFIAEGGEYRQASVVNDSLDDTWEDLSLSDDSQVAADLYVFACGPWMGKLFPHSLGSLIRPTKQDVLFFGTPAGDTRFTAGECPVWADHGDRFFYGMPANRGHGFKIASDVRGPAFDPTRGERVVGDENLQAARDYVGYRFPALKDAPLLETRVCQYEDTPDAHFIVDRHPERENVWLVGGGSGHGFKHGPALGELVAELILEQRKPEPWFQLARFR
ncbi:MAG: FAD-dependent oxidoreductase [Acidobacteriales bacterium]|nr:FAD-dependent oxidoreductase [Terriglobales bacterium]